MDQFWKQIYFGNTILDYSLVVGAIVIGFLVLRIIKYVGLKKLKNWAAHTKTSIDDFILNGIEKSVIPLLYILLVYAGINYLTVPEKLMKIVTAAVWICVMFFVLRAITSVIKQLVYHHLEKKDDSDIRKKQARGLLVILNIVIWVLGFVFLLGNLGYNITTLIAGMGIGGIAIALAAQTILGDLFSYFIIFFDRPFEIGDFVNVGDKSGTIEYIGLKTTRVRSITGEQIVFSNKDLTDSRLHNYGRMERRRIKFEFGVTFNTTAQQLKSIPEFVKTIIEKQPDVNFDRGHFKAFSASSLDFEFIYYIQSSDYSIYMDRQQAILVEVYEKMNAEKIGFAFPVRTLYFDNDLKINNDVAKLNGKEKDEPGQTTIDEKERTVEKAAE